MSGRLAGRPRCASSSPLWYTNAMALTVLQAIKEIQHEIGGKPDSRVNEIDLINRAMATLVGWRSWRVLQRGPVEVGTVANVPYVEFPEDFLELLAIELNGNLVGSLQIASMPHLLEARADFSPPIAGHYLGALSSIDAVTENGEPRTVLHLVPTPQNTDASAFLLFYRAGWVPLKPDSEAMTLCGKGAALPQWMEGLAVSVIRAYAGGMERPAMGSLQDRLARILVGAEFAAAVKSDLRQQRLKGNWGPRLVYRSPRWEDGVCLPPS